VFERSGTWEDGELDESGLPKQHLGAEIDPMTAAAGGERSPEGMRKMKRRGSAVTTASTDGRRKHERSRSLGAVFAGALSAGPTLAKND